MEEPLYQPQMGQQSHEAFCRPDLDRPMSIKRERNLWETRIKKLDTRQGTDSSAAAQHRQKLVCLRSRLMTTKIPRGFAPSGQPFNLPTIFLPISSSSVCWSSGLRTIVEFGTGTRAVSHRHHKRCPWVASAIPSRPVSSSHLWSTYSRLCWWWSESWAE